MEQLNSYYRRSRISEKKFRQLVRYFAMDLTAGKTSELTCLTRKTVNSIFQKIRFRLAEESSRLAPIRTGEIEVDESYFGARRVRGKRRRGAFGKTIVFGIFKRNGWVYTEIVPNCQKRTLQAIIRGRVAPEVIIHSDKWRGRIPSTRLAHPAFQMPPRAAKTSKRVFLRTDPSGRRRRA